jgi:hypothetical protein
MSKTARIIFVFLLFDMIVVGGYFGYKALTRNTGNTSDDYPWVTIDQNYAPQDAIEEFIKNDSSVRNLLPVYIKNYGHDASILRRFKGTRFAKPNPGLLDMFFKGLRDWILVDLKYKNEKKQDVQRTILYVNVDGTWKVGDNGSLLK